MPLIRPATGADRAAVYEICLRTGDAGEDATDLVLDPMLLGEVYAGAYLEMPSAIGFVAEEAGAPVGYILAAIDSRRFESECEAAWWPPLRARYPEPGPPPWNPDQELISVIHHPHLAREDMAVEFPAHLHLDVLREHQGRGLGRALMEQLLVALTDRGSPGVHLVVDLRNQRAIGFYRHLGFVDKGEIGAALVMALSLGAPSPEAGAP